MSLIKLRDNFRDDYYSGPPDYSRIETNGSFGKADWVNEREFTAGNTPGVDAAIPSF